MLLIILLGVAIIIFSIKPAIIKNHKIIVSCVLIGLNVFYFYGLVLLDTSVERYVTWLLNLNKALAIISVIMIFLTALGPSSNEKQKPSQKLMHMVNILVGIIIVGWALIFSFGVLAFAGLHFALLIPTGAILIWILLYWIQYKTVLTHKGITIALSFLTVTLPFLIYYQYYG